MFPLCSPLRLKTTFVKWPSSVQRSRAGAPPSRAPFPHPPSCPSSLSEPELGEPKAGPGRPGGKEKAGGLRGREVGRCRRTSGMCAFVVMAGRKGGVVCEGRLVGGWWCWVGGGREGGRGKGGWEGVEVGSMLCLFGRGYNIVAAQISILWCSQPRPRSVTG
jgi:hypothetical protein